jgi:hypothetical protein
VCSCTHHPGSDVLAGHLFQEEDLYRRSDIARHTRRYLDNDWIYPFAVSCLSEGKAALIQDVACYRASREFGYRMLNQASFINVVLSSPRSKPVLIDDRYAYEEDRAHMYLTLPSAKSKSIPADCTMKY